MKHLIALPLIALLLSAVCISSCSSDVDDTFSVNRYQDQNITDSINNLIFSGFDSVSDIETIVKVPARLVTKDEFYANYHPIKTNIETYSDDSRSPASIRKVGSNYEVTITPDNRIILVYETRYPYEFPAYDSSKYHVIYRLSKGEIAGDAKVYRESTLQLAASIEVYTKSGDQAPSYSHTAGFTVRIDNKKFRIINYN